ncbi:hypothetical protein JJB99_27175 [Bradyrhizobium diazoefficiens]|uniref:hypothetical protein n=1 Tax=Bradyrhizobium diazoefficiens TaxID=1355477 RepID=UPI00190B1B42|nr:hypothetical protein [Bradyrhizobium diazoefficiens]QQO13090.1 hypothetical protein JJB99_27175 [Bradyrhizobium diazoefficiens]
MIRKPAATWGQPDDDRVVRTVRTASAAAETSYSLAQRGGTAIVGLILYGSAALWGFAAIVSGLAGSLPSFIGIGAMAAFAFWGGRKAFAKARAG